MSRAASVLPFCNISGQDRPSLRASRLAQARQVDDRPTWCVLLSDKNLPSPRARVLAGRYTPGKANTWAGTHLECSLCIRASSAASRQPQIPTRTPALFRTSTESQQQTASTPNNSNTNSLENINTRTTNPTNPTTAIMHFPTSIALALAGTMATVAALPQAPASNKLAARQSCVIEASCIGSDLQPDKLRSSNCCAGIAGAIFWDVRSISFLPGLPWCSRDGCSKLLFDLTLILILYRQHPQCRNIPSASRTKFETCCQFAALWGAEVCRV